MSEIDNPRILVAEDEPVSRQILISCLRSWKYEVQEAADGEAAMMALRKPTAPHMALLDWEMPKMDGIEICRRVREADRTVYIIMLTAKNDKSSMLEALEAGADDYMVKPCDPNELKARLMVGQRTMQLHARVAEFTRENSELRTQLDLYRRGRL